MEFSQWTFGAGVPLDAAVAGTEEILPGGKVALTQLVGSTAGYATEADGYQTMLQYASLSRLDPANPGILIRWMVLRHAEAYYVFQGRLYEPALRGEDNEFFGIPTRRRAYSRSRTPRSLRGASGSPGRRDSSAGLLTTGRLPAADSSARSAPKQNPPVVPKQIERGELPP